MKFAYSAYDLSGRTTAGTVEAADADTATEALRAQKLFVTRVAPADESGGRTAPGGRSAAGRGKVSAGRRLKAVSVFARQLSVLLASGTPIVQALSVVERQGKGDGFGAVVARVRAKVEEGVPLSDAMTLHPEYFDQVCQSLAAAGEQSGSMAPMLDRLSALTRKQLQLRSAITGAMVYPLVLSGIGLCVTALMLLFVLPRFSGLFETLETPLPPTTRMMLAASTFLQDYWWAVLLVLGGGGAGLWYGLRSPGGKRWFDRSMLRAPKLAGLTRSVLSARVARMLGVLLESRVPLLDSLKLTRQACPNVMYASLLERAEAAVSQGEPVSAVLSNSDLISPAVQEALRSGEQSGQVGGPLIHMADFLDEENEVVIKALTKLLEPLILCVMGILVGLMAVSMFLPLFDLVSSASGGAK
ncbi:MAG TPA: type II secretion system F family protein [Tepidisphaeraceae bacterium]|nr:type II secretion system F family protein [Tepidisphaeraceae bacterium]